MNDHDDRLESDNEDDNYIELDDYDEEEHIRLHGKKNLWFEAGDIYSEYIVAKKINDDSGDDLDDTEEAVRGVLEKFVSDEDADNPSDLKKYGSDDGIGLMQALKKSHVRLLKADTFTMQEGNIYDFGGYRKYNFGPGYEENHMSKAGAKLNSGGLPHDKADSGGPSHNGIENIDSSDVWITKTIGGAFYEYFTQCPSVTVKNESDSYEFRYGGKTEERRYNSSGQLLYKKIIDDSKIEEKFYEAGEADEAYSIERPFGENSESIFSKKAEHSLAFNLSASAEEEFTFGAKSEFAMFGGAKSGIEISLAAVSGINVMAGVESDVKLGYGGRLEYERNPYLIKQEINNTEVTLQHFRSTLPSKIQTRKGNIVASTNNSLFKRSKACLEYVGFRLVQGPLKLYP
ncbi:MAG: hypothetical protein ACLFMN_04200 [Desulfobacterales bacterium]